jgi:hypothetical protein
MRFAPPTVNKVMSLRDRGHVPVNISEDKPVESQTVPASRKTSRLETKPSRLPGRQAG